MDFTIIDQTHVIAKSAIEGWVENKACSIFKSGKIHLRAAKGAKEGENVHVYVSAGKFGQIAGGAADSADGASTVELLGCKWQEKCRSWSSRTSCCYKFNIQSIIGVKNG